MSSRRDFYKRYVLQMDKEFEFDGEDAAWAPSTSGNLLYWGQEQSTIDLTDYIDRKGFIPDCGMALSQDGQLLAIMINKVVLVYSIGSKQLKTELTAANRTFSQLYFVPFPSEGTSSADDSAYVLLASAHDDRLRMRDEEYSAIVTWKLDRDGQPLTVDEGDGRIVVHGSLPGWQSVFHNYNGTRFFFIAHNEPTQRGMREADLLPQIVIYTSPLSEPEGTVEEICRLKGHEDAIMWASWSPKKGASIVVSAAWDGTYRIWDTQTGECHRKIEIPSEKHKWAVQNWSGSFSPDGDYVMLSGTYNYAVYKVEGGNKVIDLAARDGIKLNNWMRLVTWCPDSQQGIAVANERQLLLWQPFASDQGEDQDRLDVVLQIKDSKERYDMQEIYEVKWLDRAGQLLGLVDSAGNCFVWHRTKAWKWRFERPKDVDAEQLDLLSFDILYNEAAGVFYTLNLDKKVREWRF